MKKLFIIFIAIAMATTACSKKSSGGSAPVDPGPGPTPSDTNYNLNTDGLFINVTSKGAADLASRSTYKKFLRTAMVYQVYKSSSYGTDVNYDYETVFSCTNDLLDKLYDQFGYDFINCSQYSDFINYLGDVDGDWSGEMYIQIKQTTGNVVSGSIFATSYDSNSNYYYIEHEIPFKGKIVKNDIGGGKYYYSIEIGGLFIYTMDNTVLNPNLRELTIDTNFDGVPKEMGYLNVAP